MTRNEAYTMIQKALESIEEGICQKFELNENTHLVKSGVLDSLEIMNFIFELEQLHGNQLTSIDETFDDYRISRLIDILLGN